MAKKAQRRDGDLANRHAACNCWACAHGSGIWGVTPKMELGALSYNNLYLI